MFTLTADPAGRTQPHVGGRAIVTAKRDVRPARA